MKLKIVSLFTIFLILFSMALPTSYAAAEKTLDQLLAEAEANRKAYNDAKKDKELTEAERNEATAQKKQVESEIASINKQIESTEKQIEEIQKDIDKKDEQMKDIMGFVQVTNGDSNYLEYIFGATDFTDFIYRISVAEQLGSYNEQLIEEYNKDVEKLDNKKSELSTKQSELNTKQQELAVLEAKLNEEIETINEGMLSKDDEYKTLISTINNLKNQECKGNETLTQCQNRKDKDRPDGIVVTGKTYMPIKRGRVTSDYGYRASMGDYHTGVDFSNSVHGDSVYPVAAGEVVNITYPKYSGACGNHIVYVYHTGLGFTTSYWHMTSVNVRVGQGVNPDTKLGSMGGLASEDSCSAGTHVHLNAFSGLHTTNSGRKNPHNYISNIPSKGVYFTSSYGSR